MPQGMLWQVTAILPCSMSSAISEPRDGREGSRIFNSLLFLHPQIICDGKDPRNLSSLDVGKVFV